MVSFPFIMNSALQSGGSGNGTSIRHLEMPTFALDDDQTGFINNVWRVKSNIAVVGGEWGIF